MNNYKNHLMNKNGIAITRLARDFIGLSVGDRIDTVAQMSEKYKLARGTIQSAIKFLSSIGAVEIISRGHLGSYIDDINNNILWAVSGNSNIVGVMPLPYSKRYEGLATGLYRSFENENINFSLAFMRGSIKRMCALSEGIYSFAIVSKLAAEEGLKLYDNISMIYEFSKSTYVSSHGIIFREGINKIKSGLKVAVDKDSIDQKILTQLECEDYDIEYIDISYNQAIRKIESKEIDFAIWNIDEIDTKNSRLNIEDLKNKAAIELAQKDTIAVIIINNKFKEIFASMIKFINFKDVENIQSSVISGELIPMY